MKPYQANNSRNERCSAQAHDPGTLVVYPVQPTESSMVNSQRMRKNQKHRMHPNTEQERNKTIKRLPNHT